MSDPIAKLRADSNYPNETIASALFFCNDGKYAVRVEAPLIGLEFTDGADIGADATGFLFYKQLSHLGYEEKDTMSTYEVSTKTDCGKVYALVEFFHDGSKDCYAQFVAEDPNETVEAAKMSKRSDKVVMLWKQLKIGSTTATVHKDSNNATITLKADTIHKGATWQGHSAPLKNASINVQGTLYFKDSDAINQGTHANYSDDRVIFYNDQCMGTEFKAYFVPFEGQVGGVNCSDSGVESGGVVWSNK